MKGFRTTFIVEDCRLEDVLLFYVQDNGKMG